MNDAFTTLLTAGGVGSVLVGIFAFILKRVTTKAMDKLENAVVRAELESELAKRDVEWAKALADLVTSKDLKLTRLEIMRDVDIQMTQTRHSIMNNINPVLLSLQEGQAKMNEAIAEVAKTTARTAGILEGAQLTAIPIKP